jgi:hypothetical protein
MASAAVYIFPVRKRERESEWRVIRMRARGEYIGTVTAPDEEAAVRAALKAFGLDKKEADRLLVWQC